MEWSLSTKLKILRILRPIVEIIEDKEFVNWIKEEYSRTLYEALGRTNKTELILKTVFDFYNIDEEVLSKNKSSRKVFWVKTRYVIANLLLKYSDLSYREVGHIINRDRCTVIHAEKKLDDWEFTKSVEWMEYKKIEKILIKEIEYLNSISTA